MSAPSERARTRVAEARVARLGTIDPDGRPNLVPFCPVLDGDTIYHQVDRKPKTTTSLRRVENLLARPDCTVIVDHYEEAWERVWWVRMRGLGRILESGEEFERADALLRAKFPQVRNDPIPPAIIAIDIQSWTEWSYTS